jgi:hypothetical protein
MTGRRTVDLPVLAFATAVAGWAAWFGWDAWHAAPEVENLILILPATVAAVLVYLFVVAGCVRTAGAGASQEATERRAIDRQTMIRIVGSMALLGALAAAGPLGGFDVASFVYMAAMLLLLGERRPLVLLLAPALFTTVVVFGFNKVLATPLPMVFFHEAA